MAEDFAPCPGPATLPFLLSKLEVADATSDGVAIFSVALQFGNPFFQARLGDRLFIQIGWPRSDPHDLSLPLLTLTGLTGQFLSDFILFLIDVVYFSKKR